MTAWLSHVKKTMKSHKGMKFGQVLKLAAKTYKKGGSSMYGGSDVSPASSGTSSANLSGGPLSHAASVGGRRRKTRRGRKSRRGGGGGMPGY
jgi:hypothetical protein